MTSGIVVKIYKNYVIVLTETYEYIKIKKGSLTPHIGDIYLGDRLDVKPNGYYLKKYKVIIIMLFLALVLALSYISYEYLKPVNYIYIKGYEEINLKVNRFNRVIGVDSLNDNADKILSETKVFSKKSSTSIIDLFDTSISLGILGDAFKASDSIYNINITDKTNSIDISRIASHLKNSSFQSRIVYNGTLLFESNNK